MKTERQWWLAWYGAAFLLTVLNPYVRYGAAAVLIQMAVGCLIYRKSVRKAECWKNENKHSPDYNLKVFAVISFLLIGLLMLSLWLYATLNPAVAIGAFDLLRLAERVRICVVLVSLSLAFESVGSSLIILREV